MSIDEKAWDEVVRCMPEQKDVHLLIRGALVIYEAAKVPEQPVGVTLKSLEDWLYREYGQFLMGDTKNEVMEVIRGQAKELAELISRYPARESVDVEPEHKPALAELLNNPSTIERTAVAINDGDDLSVMPKQVQKMMLQRARNAIRAAMTPTNEIEDQQS